MLRVPCRGDQPARNVQAPGRRWALRGNGWARLRGEWRHEERAMRAGHRAGHRAGRRAGRRRAGMRDRAGWALALLVPLATLTATTAATTLVPVRAVAAAATGDTLAGARAQELVASPVQDPRAVLEHWNPDRLASATPVGPPAAAPAGRRPTGRAGRMGVRGDGDGKGQEWTGDSTKPPASTIGQLFFRLPDGSGSRCPAGVVDSESGNLLVTAAHCVYGSSIQPGSGPPAWRSSFLFVPASRDLSRPLGAWPAVQAFVFREW